MWSPGASWAERGDHLEVVLGHELADGEFALDQHGQRRRLHAADARVVVVGERVGAGEVHPDQPVGPAAAARRVGERIVLARRASARRSPCGWRPA